MKLRFKTDRRTDGQTDRDTSALVELRFAAKKRMKEVEQSIHGLKKHKITDRIWETRNNISYKFKDKQFVSVTDPRTGKLTSSKEETYDAILEYNYQLLRKDVRLRSRKF